MLRPFARALITLTATGAAAALVALSGTGLAMASPRATLTHRSAATPATPVPAPFGRVWQSWVYDPAEHDVVLFGGDTGHGANSGKVLGTTWTWGGRWTEKHPANSPSARTGPPSSMTRPPGSCCCSAAASGRRPKAVSSVTPGSGPAGPGLSCTQPRLHPPGTTRT